MERTTFADWPQEGPIDLAVHDLPHRSSATEWWYVNTHVTTADGQDLSLFAAFLSDKQLVAHFAFTSATQNIHQVQRVQWDGRLAAKSHARHVN